MKKPILIFILLLINATILFSQNSISEAEKYSTTIKLWGFLKYYHPQVAKGKFNWDKQFIDILPKVEEAKTKEELSAIYINWIESLGEVKECKSCNETSNKEYFNKNFDLSWTQNSDYFNKELSDKLKYIEENRNQGKSYYVDIKKTGNIEVKNEPEYLDKEYPDRSYRLLSLANYWNTVEYFFPYKYLTDQKWDEVLLEMIPRFLDAENAVKYHVAMHETVNKLDDTHAGFYTKVLHEDFWGKKYLPIIIRIIEDKVVITGFKDSSFATKNDLRIGDIIETIDGEDALDRINRINKYVKGSNKTVKSRNYSFIFFHGFNDIVSTTIIRNEKKITKKLKRYTSKESFKPAEKGQEKYKILDNNIGYINLAELKGRDMKNIEEIMTVLMPTKALIIDLRNYPKIKPNELVRHFVKTEKEYMKFTKPDFSYPGKFYWLDYMKLLKPSKRNYYKESIVLLVNEETQSKAESIAMLLQVSDKIITIGSQTSGANGNISKFYFSNYWSFASGLGVYYPDGTETQRVGVKVDIKVNRTIKGVQEGRDEILEKAIEILNQ